MEFLIILPCIIFSTLCGYFIAYYLLKYRIKNVETSVRNESQIEIAKLTERLLQSTSEIKRLQNIGEELQKSQLSVAEERARSQEERKGFAEKLELLTESKQELTAQFKSLANEIFENKNKHFTEQTNLNITQLLEPLKQNIAEFKGKIEEIHLQEVRGRSSLEEQVKLMLNLNNSLSKDAHNLTKALKGQAKTQGNWGEMILETVLESSGLRKEHEYLVQMSLLNVDNKRMQPDIIINLPDKKHLVIDAKVSLTAYEEYINNDGENEREEALLRHLDSLRSHIKGLGQKNYQQLYSLNSLDFVVMFVPLEPAFMHAIAADPNLWKEAWDKNILLVSPSTTLFVLRTVANLWRQENQKQNAQEIAKRGAELYEKLVGFTTELISVGNNLDQAKNSYDEAMKKLSTGKGNVIRQAELLKQLGIKPNKNLAQNILECALD